jgi:hypothetical protein
VHLGNGDFNIESTSFLVNSVIVVGDASSDGAIGGALHIADNAKLRCKNCTLNHNTARSAGGGIAIFNSSVVLEGALLRYNHAGEKGGAAALLSPSDLTLIESNVQANSAGVYGAGVYANSSRVNIQSSELVHNDVGSAGGAVYASLTDVTANDSSLKGNSARPLIESGPQSTGGGGFYSDRGSLSLSACTVVDNSALPLGAGGGLKTTDSEVLLTGNVFSHNSALAGAVMRSHMPFVTLTAMHKPSTYNDVW